MERGGKSIRSMLQRSEIEKIKCEDQNVLFLRQKTKECVIRKMWDTQWYAKHVKKKK